MRLQFHHRPRAFSLAELLVVIGVISLLLAVLLPPIQLARRSALDTVCASQMQQLGLSLNDVHTEFEFYPLWDDGVGPTPYTWIDLLVQRRVLRNPSVGYCPFDMRPDPLNEARGRSRGFTYPGDGRRGGVDYSYGIGVPLSAGGWRWRPTSADTDRPRRFDGHTLNASRRVLAADSNWTQIYNLSGRGQVTGIWNDPSWYDNTVAWRHRDYTANVLYQDGHVARLRFAAEQAEPVDTAQSFVWQPGEPVHVGPDSRISGSYYPNAMPPSFQTTPKGDVYPSELLPYYYTVKRSWTLIGHKSPGTTTASDD